LGRNGGDEGPPAQRPEEAHMNVNTAANILLIAAAVVWILARQVKASPIKSRLLVLAPLIMGYFGIKDTPASTWKSGADLGFIVVGALFSLGLGFWRGNTVRVWRETDGTWWRAGTRTTLYLWGALLLVRGVLAVIADSTGHKAADGLGTILFSLALSFAAQNVVIAMHMSGSGFGAPAVGAPANAQANTPVNASGIGAGGAAGMGGAGPVDLAQYNRQPGQYGNGGGTVDQGGYEQPADYGQPEDYGRAPGYPQQQGQAPSGSFLGQANARHERIQQRRADRRARRSDRRGY
jgi:hypothetical protein